VIPRLRYRGPSAVDVRVDSAVIGLATHADLQAGYLTATVLQVDVVRDALRAVHAMLWMQETSTTARDAWFTVDNDVLFLEAPAADGRAWLRVRLARTLLSRGTDVAEGTTTLRFPQTLGRQLDRLSAGRATSFVVAPGGADVAIDGSILDERDAAATPAAWATLVRLSSTPAPASASAMRIAPSSLVLPLAGLARADSGQPLVVAADPPWRDRAVVVGDGARYVPLAPLLAHARSLAFFDDGSGCVLDAGDVVATITVARDDAMATANDAPLDRSGLHQIAARFPCTAEEFAAAHHTGVDGARRVLDALAADGAVFVDVDGRYRRRSFSIGAAR
jgi:hypothetical protein